MLDSKEKPPDRQEAEMRLAELAHEGSKTVVYGILGSALLAAVKIITGVLGNSYALIADGIESMLDMVSSLAVFSSLKIAAQPPDRKYPYGYGKIEPVAALAVAVALFVAAAGIAIQSIREILTPHHTPAPFTLLVLVGVVVAKEVMFRYLHTRGTSLGSTAMEADAWHHRSDAITSLAAFIGISVALIGGKGYESADDWAALSACVLILINGMGLVRSALRGIMDVAPPPEIEEKVRALGSAVEGVETIEKCRIRRSGLVLFVDIHVVVDGEISVNRGHQIAHAVKDRLLRSELNILDATVHVEPAASLVE